MRFISEDGQLPEHGLHEAGQLQLGIGIVHLPIWRFEEHHSSGTAALGGTSRKKQPRTTSIIIYLDFEHEIFFKTFIYR